MKALLTAVFVLTRVISYGQTEHQPANCSDSVKIAGYYALAEREVDRQLVASVAKKNAKTTTQRFGVMDVFTNALFVPLDSLRKGVTLARRLDHFCGDATSTVFTVCGDRALLARYCEQPVVPGLNRCHATDDLGGDLYKTTANTGEAYTVFYVEGYWRKLTVLNSPFERGQVGGLTATRCIQAGPRFFTLYFCTSIQQMTPARNLTEQGMIRVE